MANGDSGERIDRRPARPARFVKVARTEEHDERIRREAAVLRGLRHAGVVTFVSADTAAFPAVLITERVDGPSLARSAPLPADEVERLLAAVRATLADLHLLGVVHGAVAPEHILVRPDRRPVLCGFGYAGRVGDPAVPLPPALATFAHPQRAETGLTPEVDRYALDAVRRALLPPEAPAPVAAGMAPVRLRRRLVIVGALAGGALLVAVAAGITNRRGPTDTPSGRVAVTTTRPVQSGGPGATGGSTTRGGVGGILPGSSGEGLTFGDGPSGEAASGAAVPASSRRAGATLPTAGRGPGIEADENLAAEPEPACPPEGEIEPAPLPPLASARVGPAPIPTATAPRVRASGPPQPSTPRTADLAAPAPASGTLPWPLLSPLDLPGTAELSPGGPMPPPESLDDFLPAPETMAASVELPDESSLLPPVSVPESPEA